MVGEKQTISIEIEQAAAVTQFATAAGRKYGMLYFHLHGNGKFNLRTIGQSTEVEWLKQEIAAGRIFIPTEKITAEES